MLPLVGRTPEREAVFDFTFPYLTLHGAVFVRKVDTRIKQVSDLSDKTVVVMRGDNAEEFARRTNISSSIVAVETYKQAMQLLEAGKYDAVIAQRLMGIYLLDKLKIKKVVPLDFDLKDLRQDFCFAVRDGDRDHHSWRSRTREAGFPTADSANMAVNMETPCCKVFPYSLIFTWLVQPEPYSSPNAVIGDKSIRGMT